MISLLSVLKYLPPDMAIKVLRKTFAMPAPAARWFLNDVTRPQNHHHSWIHKVSEDAWSGCWIGENVQNLSKESLQKSINNSQIIFFNVHGGGFRTGNCTMFMDTYIRWIQMMKEQFGLNALIMSIGYRLAPEFRYPSALEDIVKAYEHLTHTMSVDSSKVIVTGDSAGAALAMEMLFITHDPSMFEIETDDQQENVQSLTLPELPRPAGTIFISPIVTDKTTSDSWKENVKYDYIGLHTAKAIKRDYFEPLEQDEVPSENQHLLGIATLETGFSAFLSKRVLMFIGDKEVLRDDALDLAARANRDGVVWKTVCEDLVHDWFCVREVVADKSILERADGAFANFCFDCISPSFTSTTSSVQTTPVLVPSITSSLPHDTEIDDILHGEFMNKRQTTVSTPLSPPPSLRRSTKHHQNETSPTRSSRKSFLSKPHWMR